MLDKTSAFHSAFQSSNRELFFRVTIGGTVYDKSRLFNAACEYGIFSDAQLVIGTTFSNSLKIVFSEVITSFNELDEVVAEMGIRLSDGTVEYCPLGTFVISERVDVNRNDKTTSIFCLDNMALMEGTYESSLSYPAQIRDVALEIANKSGMTINTTNFSRLSTNTINKIEGATYRQAIGMIAQFEAAYALFNRQGELEIRTLNNTEFEISPDHYRSKGLVKNDLQYRLGGISVDVDDESSLQAGSTQGSQISLENSAMTQTLLNSIYSKIENINFYPFTLEWWGNPALEIGDWVIITDLEGNEFKAPVLSYKLTFDGGISSTLSADVETTSNHVTTYKPPLKQKLEQLGNSIVNNRGNVLYFGLDQPVTPKEGDAWFTMNGPDEEYWVYKDDQWVEVISKAIIRQLTEDVEKAISDAEEAKKAAEDAYIDAVSEADRLVDEQTTAFDNKIADVNQEINTVKTDIDDRLLLVNQDIANNFTSLSNSISNVNAISNQAKADAAGALGVVNSVNQNVNALTGEISTLMTRVNGNNVLINQVKNTADGTQQTVANHAGRLTIVETNVNGLQTTVANKAEQSQVTQMANSLTSLVTSLNGVSSGGKNLLTNGSFENWTSEYGFIGWGKYSGTSDSSVSHSGGNALYIGASSGTKGRQDIPVIPGNTYEIKAWVQTSSNANGTANNQKLRIGNYDGGALLTDIGWSGTKTEWTEISKEWTVPAGVTMIQVTISSNHTVGWVRWDDISIIDITNEKATQSQITQLSTDINLRVTKGDVVNQINVSTESILIAGKKIQLDGDVTMTSAFTTRLNTQTLTAITANITSIRSQVLVTDSVTSTHVKADNAMIDNLFATTALITRLTSKSAFISNIQAINISADRITSGTLNSTIVNAISLNVSQVTGLNSSFIQSTWNGLNSSLSIDSAGLKSYSSQLEIRLTAGYLRYYVDNVQIGYITPLDYTSDTTNKALGIVAPSGGNIILGRSVTGGVRESIHINGTTGDIGIKRPLDFSLGGVDLGKIYVHPTNGLIISSAGAEIQFFQGGTSLMYGVAGGLRMYRQINMNQNPIDNVSSLVSTEVATPTVRNITNLETPSTLSFTRAGVIYSQMIAGGFRMQVQINMNTYNIAGVGTLTYASDARYKSNITTRDVSDLDIIRSIRYVDYTFNRDGSRQRGLIAQELMNADSKLVTTSENGYLSYDSQQYTHAIGHGLQELDGNVRDLRDGVLRTNKDFLDKIAELENKIQQLEEKIA